MRRYPEGVALEDCPCPMGCSAGDTLVLEGSDRIHGIAGVFRVVRCSTCGLMRTNPRPSPETIGAYYPDSYGPYSATEDQQPGASSSSWKKRLRRWLGLNARTLPPVRPGSAVEIGCASGNYLQQMCRDGWTVQGIEFSASAARQARARGFHVETGAVESANPSAQPVDMVVAWMVVEHLHDPVAALQRIRAWVKPDGYLVGSVPIHGGLFLRLFGNASYDLHLPNHLYHFNGRSLARLLAAAGWQLERVVWQRNANTLLWTLEYTARDRGWSSAAKMLAWLRASQGAARMRMLIAWLLGITRTSGRIEFWARPRAR